MTRTILVDDHLLIDLLTGEEPDDLRPNGERMFSTGLWYHRLCRALSASSVTGMLSRRLAGVGSEALSAALRSLVQLPETIGLLSLRELAWPMARLVADGARLNLLSLEALAAAESLNADICLASPDDNPPLAQAAAAHGIALRVVEPKSR